MLDLVISNTNQFISSVPKSERKKYGQFFTTATTARFMANMFNFNLNKEFINLLDAGAGSGILTAAVADKIFSDEYNGHLHATCYETDIKVLPLLIQNLELLKTKYNFSYKIIRDNYITSQYFGVNSLLEDNSEKYDYIIGNPPYMKISKDAPEAQMMSEICHGAPNLYFLFWGMGIFNLKNNGELVYIIPRSWTSGAYFSKFRHYLFKNCAITDIHLFESRDKVFDGEAVLQETIIVKINKTNIFPKTINISSSSDSNFENVKIFKAKYNTIISPNEFVFLITNQEEADIVKKINLLPSTLPNNNLRMKTGIIVDFRTRDVLRNQIEEGAYPLLYSQHIRDGRIVWPIGKEGEVIKTNRKSFLMPMGNFLIVKRFTSKEEKRRLQCGILLKKNLNQFNYFSTQNKINFIACESPCLTYGVFVLLNSSIYDRYYRILNGSTQVNSTEINLMPVPEKHIIEEMGRELMKLEISETNCNKILNKWIN